MRRAAVTCVSAARLGFSSAARERHDARCVAPRNQEQQCRGDHSAVREIAFLGSGCRGGRSRTSCRVLRGYVKACLEKVSRPHIGFDAGWNCRKPNANEKELKKALALPTSCGRLAPFTTPLF